MMVLSSTNEMICDDHGTWECVDCTVTEVSLDVDVDVAAVFADVFNDGAQVIELPARIIDLRPVRELAA